MACVKDDGTLNPSAYAVLHALSEPKTAEDIASISGQPLFKVRSNIREMLEAELISQTEETYLITDTGKSILAKQK